jgi:hypothetical protein
MKGTAEKLFIFYCLAWCIVHFLRYINCTIPWINDHLTDLIFIPVTANITIAIIRKYVVKNQHFQYPLWYVLSIALYASILFEFILPQISDAHTADISDVVSYFLGGLFYYYVHQKRHLTQLRTSYLPVINLSGQH